MGLFGGPKKPIVKSKSLIEKSKDVISSFSLMVTSLTELNEKLKEAQEAKLAESSILLTSAEADQLQQEQNLKVITKITDIIT